MPKEFFLGGAVTPTLPPPPEYTSEYKKDGLLADNRPPLIPHKKCVV